MTIGIYRLNFSSGAFYIGQSVNIEKRYLNHLHNLRSKKANNVMLEEYEICGTPNLEIIEDCSIEDLNIVEEFYIAKLNATNYPGLNILEKPGYAAVGQYSPTAKHDNTLYEKVFFLLLDSRNSHNSISTSLGISISISKNIASGNAHLWLKEKYPKEYENMLSLNRDKHTGTSNIVNRRPLIQDPTGIIYDLSSKSVSAFAKENSLNQSNLTAVLNGKRSHHKGWRLASEQGVQHAS